MVCWRWLIVALVCTVVPFVASHEAALSEPAPSDANGKPAAAAPTVPTPATQTETSKAPADAGAVPSGKPSTSKPSPGTKPTTAATDAVVLDPASLQSIIGRSAKSLTGEDMGRVVDTLVTSSGQVRAVIIDFGGFLGVGTRRIAVDWKALNFSDVAKGGNVIVALTRNQVRMAPEYKQGDPIVLLEATTPEVATPASANAIPNNSRQSKTDAPSKDSPTANAPPPPSPPAASPKDNPPKN